MRSFSGLGTESSSKNLLRARLISFVRGSSLSAGYHKRRSGDQRRLTRSHTPCLFRLSALLRQRCAERHAAVGRAVPALHVARAYAGGTGRSHSRSDTVVASFAERQTHVSPRVSVVGDDQGRGPVALTSLDEVAQADFFEISSRGCRVRQDGYHRFGVRAPRRSATRRPP